jgi:competence protein ComEC
MPKKYLIPILILLILNSFFALAFYNENYIQRPRVIFFDVGQGDSAMVDAGGNTQILIDGGGGSAVLESIGKYMPFYDRKIELIIMTHPDKDHMGGLVEVLKYYKVGQILETGIFCDTEICKEWDELILKKNIPVKYTKFGQKINMRNANIDILYPFENLKDEKVKDDNDASVVLKLIINTGLFVIEDNNSDNQKAIKQSLENAQDDNFNNSYLFTGDIGFKTEKELLDRNINIEAQILKVSHHGSKNATSNEFLQAVKPEKAIISVGKNSYGHPAEELLNRLKNMRIEIFRTDERGDLVLE